MCGIAGYCITRHGKVERDILIGMRDSLAHRGPDDAGLYISPDKKVGLAHRRLSIIDLSSDAAQPMANEDESIHLVYNGEIYNYKEIRQDLAGKGHMFRSRSDTEVIIHAYEEYGAGYLEFFNGMFAFALYDANSRLLFLARDRFGIKPLHYGFLADGSFVFASELKAVTRHPAFSKEIFLPALGDYFKYRYIPADRTIWKNIHKLTHGCCATLNLETGRLETRRYYSLDERVRNRPASTLEEVEANLNDAVAKRLVADVEVGALLSGGIDSSAITAIANGKQRGIKSFSIGFEPLEYSELPFSKKVAEYLGTNHITKTVAGFDDDIVTKLALCCDEPLADSSCLPTYILCEMVSGHVKVALSGDGGDEVFAGYEWYKTYLNSYRKHLKYNVAWKIKRLFGADGRVLPGFEKRYNKILLDRFTPALLKKLFTPEAAGDVLDGNESLFERYTSNPWSGVRAVQHIDMNTFMVDDILTKVDRTSMAHSLEVRVPLLDHALVESVFALGEADFPSDSVGKPVLKRLARGLIPDEVMHKRKQGFSAPLNKWKHFDRIGDEAREGSAVKDGLLRRDFVAALQNGSMPRSEAMLWMIFVFEMWYRRWVRK
ncbi:MAG: asparagine synthase (glutamine-hydrolyzing) [Planctomycetota bacterium]